MAKILTGEEIKALRIKKGLTQFQLGYECNIQTATISRIEHGMKPSAEVAIKLSRFFGMSLDRFWQDDGAEVES